MQFFVLRGNCSNVIGHSSAEILPGASAIMSPGERHEVRVDGNYERLGLKLKPKPLTKKLSAMIGEPINRPLIMVAPQDAANAAAGSLQRLVSYVVNELTSAPSDIPALVIAEFEQALMTAFLSCNRHNYSDFLERKPPDVAPWQVRRAEEYIKANWNRPILVEDIAAVVGASARSMFRTFKKFRGYSPLEFVKRQRLLQAKQMFDRPGPQTSVSDVALACGFSDLGRFSGEYRRCFGELPSEALGRSRGAPPRNMAPRLRTPTTKTHKYRH